MSCHLAQARERTVAGEPLVEQGSLEDEDEGVQLAEPSPLQPLDVLIPGLQGQREVDKFDPWDVRQAPGQQLLEARGGRPQHRHRAALAAPTGKPDDPGAVLRRDLLAVIG